MAHPSPMLAVAVLLLWSVLPRPAAADETLGDQIVAVIDRQIITARDLDYYVFERRLENPDLFSVPDEMIRPAVAPAVIDEWLLFFWADLEIENTPEEAIDARYRAAMGTYIKMAGGEQQLRDAAREVGLTAQDFRKWVRERAQRHYVIRQAMATNAGVSDWGPVDQDPSTAERLRLAQILIVPAARSEEAEQAALELALRIRRDIAAGMTFEQAARLHSQDASSASRGGDLGWLDAANLQEDILAAARQLQPGGTSQPIRTRAGLHLIHLQDYDTKARLEFLRRMRDAENARLRSLRQKHSIKLAEGYELSPAPEPDADGGTKSVWDSVDEEVPTFDGP